MPDDRMIYREACTHICPIAGCHAIVPSERLMCRSHWRMVPRGLQMQVYVAWNNASPLSYYPSVRAAAIAAVNSALAGGKQ